MKTFQLMVLCFFVSLLAAPSTLLSRDKPKTPTTVITESRSLRQTSDRPLGAKSIFSGAAIDTFVLAGYTFDGPFGECDTQGWIAVDKTAQYGIFFHVDDFAGLNGGDYGRLTPLSGNQSLWCGIRADSTSEQYCGWVSLPGYGNNWVQHFSSAPIPVSGDATLSYQIRWDTEPGYDYVYVEYMDTAGSWVELEIYTGIGETSESWIIPENMAPDSVTIRFRFMEFAAWSDEDGLWDTDGAVIIDSLVVADSTGVVDYQDFELEAVDATSTTDGRWIAGVPPGYGVYAGLFQGGDVLQEDPCQQCDLSVGVLQRIPC